MFDGVRRSASPLPTRPGRVHAYLLEGADGWTLVDTGLSLTDLEEGLAEIDVPVTRIVITHMHPTTSAAASRRGP